MALDQRDQCALVSLADDGVAVPVADRAFLVHDGRAQLDAHAVIELATPLLAAAVAFPARPPGAACLRTCSRSNPVSREYRHEEKIRQRYQPREVRRDPPPPCCKAYAGAPSPRQSICTRSFVPCCISEPLGVNHPPKPNIASGKKPVLITADARQA